MTNSAHPCNTCSLQNGRHLRSGKNSWARCAAWSQHSWGPSTCFPYCKHHYNKKAVAYASRLYCIMRSPNGYHSHQTYTNTAPIRDLVPTAPCALGASDASAQGKGGFWIPTTLAPPDSTPFVWRYKFEPQITCQLISTSNPNGLFSINELELAALIQAYHSALQSMPLPTHGTFLCATDNISAHAWITHGPSTTAKAPAYLLQMLATLARSANCTFDSAFTAGSTNTLANFCSRSFALNDATFLDLVNAQWPMQKSWRLVHPTNDTRSQWTSALFRRNVEQESVLHARTPTTPSGAYGAPSVTPSIKMNTCPQTRIPSRYSNSLLVDTESVTSLPQVLRYAVEQWKAPYAPLARRSPHWATLIPAC
jgi:hypothetical protein